MGLLVIADVPDIDAEGDRDIAEQLGLADGSVPGFRFRLSGDYATGRRIVTFWDSRDAFEAWRDDRLAAVLLATGRPVPPFEVWEIDQTFGL